MKPFLVFMLLVAAASAVEAQSDNCSSAPVIGDGSYYGQTFAATIDGSSCKAGPDVWYRYTATENGEVDVASYGSFDVSVSVYSGCPGAGSQVACGSASCWGSWFRNCTSFTASAGSDYWIRVSGDPAKVSRGWYDLMVFRPGYVSGMVTDSNTGQPFSDVVLLEELSGKFTSTVYSNADGSYLSGSLPPGSYAVKATGGANHVWEAYENVRCFPSFEICSQYSCSYYCEVTNQTPVSVSPHSVTPDINFGLDLYGSLSGHVSIEGTGVPVPWTSVYIYDSTGHQVTPAAADVNGSYRALLPEGQYFAVSQTDLIDEVYDNHACPSVCAEDCDPTSGTPINITAGGSVSGIDFSLSEGGILSGIVTDASNGSPLSSATLYLMKYSGISVSAGSTDAGGHYRLRGIPAGSYTLRVSLTGYQDQVVNDVVFTEGQNLQMDFSLISLPGVGGTIAGVVTRADNGQPLGNAGLSFYKRSGPGGSYGSNTVSAADGTYRSAPLPVGEYSVFVSLNGFAGEIYDGIFCNNCSPNQGTPVPVTAGQTTTGIDFDLQQSGCITGHVLSSTGPIGNARVTVYDSLSHRINDKWGDSQGLYSICNLPPGDHFVVATNTPGFIDQLYAARDCMMGSCEKTTGTPVHVSPGGTTSGIDFMLRFGGSISGTLTKGPSGYSFQQEGNIRAFDAGGNVVSLTSQYPGSHYRLGGLVAGNYHVTAETYGLAGQLYPDLPCQSGLCDPSPGAWVAVTEGQDTAGIHFMLNESRSISGTIRDAATGEPLPYVRLKIFDPAGNSVYDDIQILSDCFGRYTVASLVPGTYFAIARSSGYIDQLYRGIPCPEGMCDPLSGTPINVLPGTDATGIDFALIPEDLVFFDNFEDASLSAAWTYASGVWTETGGFLVGSSKLKGEALARPAFSGCSKCSVVAVLQTIDKPSAGVLLLGWYQDANNHIELLIESQSDTLTLRQIRRGSIVQSAKAHHAINPNTNYRVRINFDGTRFRVSINEQKVIAMPSVGKPFGTVGFQVRSTMARFDQIAVF